MSLQDDLASAEAAMKDAASRVDAIRAKIEAALPHVSLWQELESHAQSLEESVKNALMNLAARGKALWEM
jgi:hypothetical protein